MDARSPEGRRQVGLCVAAALAAILGHVPAHAEEPCPRTAQLQLAACRHEVSDDGLLAKARCVNLADDGERAACMAELSDLKAEGNQLCRDQRDARRAVCAALGAGPYDPSFDPDDFTTDFVTPAVVNPFLPLRVGNRWDFAAPAANETNSVEVLAATKLIAGVTCVVSRDLVSQGGIAKEFTDDWLAQAKGGDVHYCGEEVKDYEIFPGDVPPAPELVSIDGSFKIGRDGDKPGVLFPADPVVGTTYRQEYSLGNAEDVATVLSTTYAYGDAPELDASVPQALAEHLCDHDCVVTDESTPTEPGSVARKYYAPGIGVFLEVETASGEVNRLVGCNVDPRCATLPQP
jgi:hypothetical protein